MTRSATGSRKWWRSARSVAISPDGALYIIDWHNALIGHLQHNLREPNRDHSHGRIWRVAAKDRPVVKAPQIDKASIASLLELMKEPEDRTLYRVRRELAARPTKDVIAGLKRLGLGKYLRPIPPPFISDWKGYGFIKLIMWLTRPCFVNCLRVPSREPGQRRLAFSAIGAIKFLRSTP